MVVNVDKKTFKEEVLDSGITVATLFYSENCRYCKLYNNIFEQLASEYDEKIKFITCNVNNAENIVNKYHITSVPHIIMFKNGISVAASHGVKNYDDTKNFIQEFYHRPICGQPVV